MTNKKSYLTDSKEYMQSFSSPNFKDDIGIYKYLATPILSLLIYKQSNNRHGCHDSTSCFIAPERAFTETERTKTCIQEESLRKCSAFQYNLLLTERENEMYDKKNNQNVDGSSDKGFFSSTDDSLSDVFDTTDVVKHRLDTQGQQLDKSASSFLRTDAKRHFKDCCDPVTMEPFRDLESQSAVDLPYEGSQSTSSLLDINQPTQALTTLTCFPAYRGDTFPFQNNSRLDHNWHVVGSKFGMKENLSRRQLFQIAAMTALGFIFVAMIIVWVFSPILF